MYSSTMRLTTFCGLHRDTEQYQWLTSSVIHIIEERPQPYLPKIRTLNGNWQHMAERNA